LLPLPPHVPPIFPPSSQLGFLGRPEHLPFTSQVPVVAHPLSDRLIADRAIAEINFDRMLDILQVMAARLVAEFL